MPAIPEHIKNTEKYLLLRLDLCINHITYVAGRLIEIQEPITDIKRLITSGQNYRDSLTHTPARHVLLDSADSVTDPDHYA